MKELNDVYRGHDLFNLFRFIVSECEDVNAYGVFLFLFDNEYEVRRFTQDEMAPEAGTDAPEDDLAAIVRPLIDQKETADRLGLPGLLDVSDMIMKPRKKSLADGISELGGKGFEELKKPVTWKNASPEDALKYEIESKGE